MKLLRKLGVPAIALAGLLAFFSPSSADARVRVGVGIGVGAYPYPYYAPYGYYPYGYYGYGPYVTWHNGHAHYHHWR